MKKIKGYGTTTEEQDALEAAKCREIVQEILAFGVNEAQIIKLIKLLALELENRNLTLGIVELVNEPDAQQLNKPTITV